MLTGCSVSIFYARGHFSESFETFVYLLPNNSMSWSDAADTFFRASQAESDEVDEADAVRRSESCDLEEFERTGVPVSTPVLPELYWAKPLLSVLAKRLPVQCRVPIRLASACSGTLAEASVAEAPNSLSLHHFCVPCVN